MRRRVLIVTEGGSKIGFGHITRCIGIYQAFEEKGAKPEFIINADDTVRHLLKSKLYRILNWIKEKDQFLRLLKGTDIVVVDSYLAALSFYKKVSCVAELAVYLDDNKRLRYSRGILVNGQIYAHKLNYPKDRDISYLLGSRYIPLRKEFWSLGKRILSKKIRNVLITFGGNGNVRLMSSIASIVKDEFCVNPVTIGGIKKVTAAKMLFLMKRCDLCISGGGQTTYELARCGIPTISIGFAVNQLLNLKAWSEMGFLEFAGFYDDRNLVDRIKKILKALTYAKRMRMSRLGRSCVDGQGSRRIVKEIYRRLYS
jgi:spore coat polysaccharide biosynthesis predicted glycosyltransferase SpsG